MAVIYRCTISLDLHPHRSLFTLIEYSTAHKPPTDTSSSRRQMAKSAQSENHNPKALPHMSVQFIRQDETYLPRNRNTFHGTDFAHSVWRSPGSTTHDPQQPPRSCPHSTRDEHQGVNFLLPTSSQVVPSTIVSAPLTQNHLPADHYQSILP